MPNKPPFPGLIPDVDLETKRNIERDHQTVDDHRNADAHRQRGDDGSFAADFTPGFSPVTPLEPDPPWRNAGDPVEWWPQPSCAAGPMGPVQVFYYNGFLYWDAETNNQKLNEQFNQLGYLPDLVRGMSGMFWGYDKNKYANSKPNTEGSTDRVENHISYNSFEENSTPESIWMSFAKSHPDDKKPPVLQALRYVAPIEWTNAEYPQDFGGGAYPEGMYAVSVLPGMVKPVITNPLDSPEGNYGQGDDALDDEYLFLKEFANSEVLTWAPYERETKGYINNLGWKKAGLSDGIPGIPYNKETIVLKTTKDIMIDLITAMKETWGVEDLSDISTDLWVKPLTKEIRFNGSAFLRLIQRIVKDKEITLKDPEPHHKAFTFRNDHCFSCYLPWSSPSAAQKEGTPEYYIDVNTKYNYYDGDYEEATAFDSVEEPLLPSLSIVAAEELTDPGLAWDGKYQGPIGTEGSSLEKLRENIHNFVTLGKRIVSTGKEGDSIESAFVDHIGTKEYDPFGYATDVLSTGKEKDIGQYFQKWAEALKKDISDNSQLEHLNNFLSADLRGMTRQFRSQIILPDLIVQPPINFDSPESHYAAPKFINKKDPLSYEPRKLMFPAYTHIKIGTHAQKIHEEGEAKTLLNYIIKNYLALPLLRAIQERADDLTFGPGFNQRLVGITKEFWAENRLQRPYEGDWDSFLVNKETNKRKSHDFSDIFAPANENSRGNDLFFYRNPYPHLGPEKTDVTQGMFTVPGPFDAGDKVETHRSWLHHYFMDGAGAYDRLPESDEFPGEASNIIAAAHGEDTDVRYGMDLLRNEPGTETVFWRRSVVKNLIHDLNKIIREKTRTYEQCIGTYACDETLFWRIEKVKIKSDGSEEKIQNFYLINDPTKNEINFVDTQVIYGTKYKYNIYAWKAVFGTETEYEFPIAYDADYTNIAEMDDQGPAMEQGDFQASLEGVGITKMLDEPTLTGDMRRWQLILHTFSYPSVRIVETLFHTTDIQMVSDRPPLPPMMEVHPYRGINDTYLVRLNASIGESVKTIPQLIMGEDASKFANNYSSEHGIPLNEFLAATLAEASGYDIVEGTQEEAVEALAGMNMPLTFRSDDPPKEFEVFMLGPDPETGSPRPPKKYIDFANAERIILPIEQGTSTSFRPEIAPNKKYYYTFRSVDIHGNISFPSKIYEIELVDDSGAIYLVTNVYEFPTSKKVLKKDVRKFMNIKPNQSQTIFAPPKNGSYINFEPKMGPLFDDNKRYKFRLTSKNSGKKLDINVKVKLTKRKTEDEKTS